MAVRKNDFMPSWLQSPNGEGQKAWKAGSGKDSLYGAPSESYAPAHVIPPPPPPDLRRLPTFPSHNDNVGARKPQRALSFDQHDHSSYNRARPSGYRRQPGKSSSDYSSGGGGGGSGGDVFSRFPRGQRSSDHSMWPRPEPVAPPNQGLERNFHQHFPSLRGASAAVDHPSPFNPSGAWEHRHGPGSQRSPTTQPHVHGLDHRRPMPRSSVNLLRSNSEEDIAARNKAATNKHSRVDRLTLSMSRASVSTTPSPENFEDSSLRPIPAERGKLQLNLSLNSTVTDAEKAGLQSRQGKAQSPNSGGKVTLRSLSKPETWKGQKTEDVSPSQPPPVHSAVAPWSNQAPPPPPAIPRTAVAKTPEAPAVMLQRQIETKSKGTSESRLNFFKSLQLSSTDSNGSSPSGAGNEEASPEAAPIDERGLTVDGPSSPIDNCSAGNNQEGTNSQSTESGTPASDSAESSLESNASRYGVIDRDHLTASFYDVIIDSGVIPFDDPVDVNEEDLRVMKVWGWTPDAYDDVECITLREVANFQAAFRSYVAKKLQSDFLVKGSLGAQRLFRRHHEYLSNLAVDSSLSLSDSSDDSSSSSSSSDEERK